MSTTGQSAPPHTCLATKRERLVLGVLSLALAGLIIHYALSLPLPETLIVAAPRQARITGEHGPERELLRRFAQQHGVRVELVYTDTPEQAVDLVELGRAHVGLALGVAPQENATEAQAPPANSTRQSRKVAYGPQYDTQPIYAVDWETSYRPGQPPSLALDELLRVAQSFSHDPDEAPALPLDSLLMLIPLLPEVRDTAPTGQSASYRFLWRTDVPRLDEAMRAFWQGAKEDGTLAALREHTLGYLPEDPDPVEMELLRRTLTQNAQPLAPAIRKAARKWKIDPFILMAVIHQESHFNPNAVSATGVRGLMQMTSTTLEHLDVQNPEDNAEVIAAGARYLAILREGFAEMGYGEDDAQYLALAAFNVGQGHVLDAISLARGENAMLPDWLRVRGTLPKLADVEIARKTRYGLCRGFEAVDFVDKVRYFSYAIKGLVVSGGTQGDKLPGLHLALAG